MAYESLLKKRAYNPAFAERGREDVVMIDVLTIRDGEHLKLVFEKTNSKWSQGVWMLTDRGLLVNDRLCPSVNIWQEGAPQEVLIQCHTEDGILSLYNIWDKGQGKQSQSYSSGMLVEELPNGRRYYCNDIGFETSFDKLVFRIERMGN